MRKTFLTLEYLYSLKVGLTDRYAAISLQVWKPVWAIIVHGFATEVKLSSILGPNQHDWAVSIVTTIGSLEHVYMWSWYCGGRQTTLDEHCPAMHHLRDCIYSHCSICMCACTGHMHFELNCHTHLICIHIVNVSTIVIQPHTFYRLYVLYKNIMYI